MNKGRIGSIAGLVVLAGSLSACGSGSKAGTAAPAPVQATTPAAVQATTPAAAAGGTTGGQTAPVTVASLLASFGAGPIDGNHQPTAPADWLARVQTEKLPEVRKPDAKMRNLMALVDEAAREKDTASLLKICAPYCDQTKQAAILAKPGALENLSLLIETAPIGEGGEVPDFALTPGPTWYPGDTVDIDFGTQYGYQGPDDFFAKHPYSNLFMNGSGGADLKSVWQGLADVKTKSS